MEITANTKAVQLIEAEEFLSGAYNDTTIDVELSEEYKGLTSFVTFNDEKTLVIAGRVSTPCLSEGLCRIGVYAVNIDDDNNVVLRYSPKPVDVLITTGTWNNRIAESNTPTASEAEKIYTLIDNAIAAGQLKGDKGDPYELTAQDKQEIVNQIPYASPSNHGMIKVPNGCGIVVDKGGSAKVAYPITSVTSTTDDIKIVKHTGGATDGQFDLTFNADKYAGKQDKLTAGENIVINNSVISSTCVIKPLALSTNKSSPTMLTDIGAGAFIASNTGYVQTSGGFNKLIGAGAELIIVNTKKDGVTQLCTTVQTGSSVLLFWDTMTSDETNENFISTLSIKKEITDNLTDRQVLSALLTKTLLENKADKNSLVMEPLDLSANTSTNPLLLSSLSKNVQDTIDSGYIVTQSGYIKTDGGFSITVGAGSEVLLTWVNNSGTAELCATVQNGYNLYAITNTMTSTDKVILYLTTNTIKTDINKTLTNRQVLGALYTKELLAGKIDTTAVGDGLKYENGKLSLDIPVATASTTYGG